MQLSRTTNPFINRALILDLGGKNMMLKVGLRKGQISMED
jgi:hypothetical protein